MSEYEFWDELGNIFNAIVAYQQKTIEFNKRFVNPWLRLGTVFDQTDHNAETLLASKKAIEIDQESPTNWLSLGDVYFKMGALDDAAGAYSKAIELNPKLGWAYANLALICATRQKFTDAINLYVKSLELIVEDKDRAMVWNRLGNVYRKVNDYENAFIAFQMADECDGQNTGFEDALDEVTVEQRVMPIIAEVYVNDNEATRLVPADEPATEETVAESDLATEAPATDDSVMEVEMSAVSDDTVAEESLPADAPQELTEADETDHVADAVAEAPTTDPEVLVVELALEQIQESPTEEIAETVEVNTDTDTAPVEEPVSESDAEATPSEEPVTALAQPVAETEPAEQTDASLVQPASEVLEVEPVADATEGAAESNQADEPTAEADSATEELAEVVEAVADVTMTPVSALVVETFADPSGLNQPIVLAVEDLSELIAAASAPEEASVEDTATESEASLEVQYETVDEAELAEITDVQPGLASASTEETVPAVAEPTAEVAEAEAVAVMVTAEADSSSVSNSPSQETAYDAYLEESAEPALVMPVEATDTPKLDLKVEPDTRNAHVWNELGNVYFNTGSYEEAVAAYSKAIELDDWFAWPYSNLALVYVQKEKYAEAILLYQRSIELFASDKDKAITWNRLGNVYRRLNDYDNAIVCYQRADELDPNNATRSLRSRFSLLGNLNMEQAQSLAV